MVKRYTGKPPGHVVVKRIQTLRNVPTKLFIQAALQNTDDGNSRTNRFTTDTVTALFLRQQYQGNTLKRAIEQQ
jgi:hypothetical protein